MKIEGKFILKVAGTLTAISLVVAALLGATNALTEDKIAAINKANTEVALAAVVMQMGISRHQHIFILIALRNQHMEKPLYCFGHFF